MNPVIRMSVVLGLAWGLVACSSINVDELLPDKSVEYKREKQAGRNLEVPPDLTSARINDRMSVPDNFAGVATNYSEYITDREIRGVNGRQINTNSVLPINPSIEVKRDGDARWLVVEGSTDLVWDRVISFWQDSGVLLEEQDPSVGVMRTSWLENRASISRDFITDAVRRAFDGLYETGTRDQYRIRFERAANNKTEIYMTHFGMEEKLVGANSSGGGENTVWIARPRDAGLEGVMLRRMMVHLGSSDERAKAQLTANRKRGQTRSTLVKGKIGSKLLIAEEFSRGWRLVGLSLDRVGFAVEDRDRSAGIYYVRYNDPAAEVESGGILSALKFWGDDEDAKETQYQIKLDLEGDNTVVTVLNSKGLPNVGNTGTRILNLLKEQIR